LYFPIALIPCFSSLVLSYCFHPLFFIPCTFLLLSSLALSYRFHPLTVITPLSLWRGAGGEAEGVRGGEAGVMQ
jgi:hypothetical protein